MNTKPFGPKGKALARITQVIDELTTSEMVNAAFLAGVRYFDVSLESAQVMFASPLSSLKDASILSVTIPSAIDIKTQVELQSQIEKAIATLGSTYLDVVLLSGGSMELFTGKTPHFEWLRQLKAKGLIHAFGVSVPSYEEFKWVVERGNVDVIEVKFNLFYQTPAAIFPFVKAKKTVLIAKSPLENGWLSGQTTDQTIPSILNSLTKPNQEQKRSILIERLKKVVRAEDLIPSALAFIFSYEAIYGASLVIHTVEELNQYIQAESMVLSYKQKNDLIDFYNQQIKNQPLI